ncbi:hypothetical protein [Rhodohalobacter sp.]|uniref:hypothetical protein n=1 Tax=Rhodohalobacter sp. TaxID=1974210 RepID=UPI002ACD804A|nr:hypothetical protein [Rhodohalobacter sp.]MDZ7757722.1 hypothetical protein [Rhodohalobacter sp.]
MAKKLCNYNVLLQSGMILSESLSGSQFLGMGLILITVTALSVTSSSGRTPSDFIKSS